MESTLNKDGLAAGAAWVAGARAKGEFRCEECGYGVTVYRSLPVCPMCHGTEWVPWVGWRHAEVLDTGDVRA